MRPAVLLLLAASALADDAVDLAWKLRAQDVAQYQVSTVSEANGQTQLTPQPTRAFQLFGYEVDAKGAYVAEPRQYTELVTPWLLRLPSGKVKPGAALKLVRPYPLLPGMNPFTAKGTSTFTGLEELDGKLVASITSTLDLVADKNPPKNQNTQYYQTVTEGRIEWTQWFDAERGVLVKARYDAHMKLRYSDEYKKLVKEQSKTDLQDYDWRMREQWDLAALTDIGSIDLGPKVREAIDKGVAFLKTKQDKDGGWDEGTKESYPGGPTSLILLALLKAGTSPKDPVIEKGFAYLRQQKLDRTYSVGLALMAIEAKYISPEETRAAEAFLDGKTVEAKPPKRKVSREDLAWMQELASWIGRAMTSDGAWGYQGGGSGAGAVVGGYDHSNSQYGVLGLYSAARCGLQIPAKTWMEVLDHWLATQEKDGPAAKVLLRSFDEKDARQVAATARGWGYNDASNPPSVPKGSPVPELTRGSMTCAGISSVCLARAQLAALRALPPEKARTADRAVIDGLAWMDRHFTVKESVYGAGWYYYYMYGVERAMVLAQKRWVGDHDWYREGALTLIAVQTADGAWASSGTETAFAVLFLKRATTPIQTK